MGLRRAGTTRTKMIRHAHAQHCRASLAELRTMRERNGEKKEKITRMNNEEKNTVPPSLDAPPVLRRKVNTVFLSSQMHLTVSTSNKQINKWSSYPTLSLKEKKKTAQASLIRNAEQSFFFFKGKRTKRKDGWGVGNLKNKQKKKMNVIVKDKVKKKKEKTRN